MRTPHEYEPRVARSHVGHYRPRIDAYEKATGKPIFVDDIANKHHFPHLCYAKVLRSPYPRARIRSIDDSAALALPGVIGILRYDEPEVRALKPTSAGWTDAVDTLSWDKQWWRAYRDRRVLGDYATWAGDEVGAVIAAETEATAEEAVRLLRVDWEVLPFVLDSEEAMAPGAPVIHPEISPDNVLPGDQFAGPNKFFDKGDVEAALAKAPVVLEVHTDSHNPTQGSLDPWCCVVDWNEDQLTVWSNSYAADQTRMHVASMLDLPVSKIRAVSHYVGGSFGRGDTGEQPFFLFTALLAKKVKRPVKFKHTRHDTFHDGRQQVTYRTKVAAEKDGTITALWFTAIANAGGHADHTLAAIKFVPLEQVEVGFAHCPNVRMEAYAVYTNRLPGTVMRGIGNCQINFNMGYIVDLLAEKLGMDPMDVAIKNFGHEWEELPDKSLMAVLRSGAERIGWEEKHHAPGQGPIYGRSKRRGVGFSCHPSWHAEWQEGRRGVVEVVITLNPDCTVLLDAPTVETGVGSNVCNVLGCAEALGFLGVTPDDIKWVSVVDTNISRRDMVQTDSAVSYLQSEVLAVAAGEVRQRVLERVAPLFELSAAELDVADGVVFPKADPSAGRPVREALWAGPLLPIVVHMAQPPNLDPPTGVPWMATFVEVEVDTDTGKVEVPSIVVVNDAGTVMYASGAESQQIGGQAQALGEAVTEEIIYDKATGRPLNFNLIDYKMPLMPDLHDIEPVLLEVWRGGGEYGACGIGEGTVTCLPRAIVNAVYNATGARLESNPVKPEKVLAALGKAR
jgi:CO/xanthine dehydrogenase Mo-binding subunit